MRHFPPAAHTLLLMLSGNVLISNIHLFVLHSPRPFCRHHSQFESDVNTLLGVKDPQLMSIAITGLGGGAYLPASGEKTPAETKGGTQTKTQSSPAPVSIVDTTARCMFFAGLLLPPLLLLLLFFPRPHSVAPVSVRFWRIGEDCAVRSVTRLITDSFYSAALIALLVQVVALLAPIDVDCDCFNVFIYRKDPADCVAGRRCRGVVLSPHLGVQCE